MSPTTHPATGFLSANDVDENDDFFVSNVTGQAGNALEFKVDIERWQLQLM